MTSHGRRYEHANASCRRGSAASRKHLSCRILRQIVIPPCSAACRVAVLLHAAESRVHESM
jgi:hypothetical protein